MNINLYRVSTVAVGMFGLAILVFGTAAALNLAATLGWTLIRTNPQNGMSLRPFVLSAVGLSIVLGILPGLLLIICRRQITRRWLLADRNEPQVDVSAPNVSRLAVGLVGFGFVAVAIHDLAQALAYSMTVPSQEGLGSAWIAPTIYIIAGAVLLLRSRQLATWWGRP